MRDGGEAREADADGNTDGKSDGNDETQGAERPPERQEHPEHPEGRSEDAAEAVEGAAHPGERPASVPARLAARLRKHWLIASAVALALLATGAAVPIVLADSGDGAPCQEIPAATRALAEDPAAATRALDPGDDLDRFDAVRELLVHEHPCGDGAKALGEVVDAATRATGSGRTHTLAQARGAFAVAAALDGVELPEGMAPGVARMLAQYVIDQNRFLSADDHAVRPAVPADLAALDDQGWTTYGRFLAPGEAHADFEHTQPYSDVEADPERLIGELAKDPRAFAILYDSERAWLAYCLERLDDRGGDPDYRPGPAEKGLDPDSTTTWVDIDLEHMTDRIGVLMKYRARYARDGTIPDLAAFDATVRRSTRGSFQPAARQLSSRLPMGDIARRPVSGPVKGDLMDARHQLLTVVDAWATARKTPKTRAAAMRQLIDDRYVRQLWLSVY
ncbi:hypothetical protein OG562_02400 [Streptomyces sp. NBC_01275]|uniref:hypothetical protein n=1 Tax=Streptomyces sp. NBC_01275 TaxID=2903807 RepID=UPI002253B472|nr:hypothetical protein [Streptomyces sp. NBC_01275]MCX4759858.1 hypothetical protein [Streptomyces sp. NBC_01275]